MRIVTFEPSEELGTIRALTKSEFESLTAEEMANLSWEEWVWQDQPTKKAAIKRHDIAMRKWRRGQENNQPEREFY